MSVSTRQRKKNAGENSLHVQLLALYGPLLNGGALQRALGYSSAAAMRQAVSRALSPLPAVFRLPNRRGLFALTNDVADWLVRKGVSAESATPTEGDRKKHRHATGEEAPPT